MTYPALAIRKNCWMPKPKVISEVAVLTQESMVRSWESTVRSSESCDDTSGPFGLLGPGSVIGPVWSVWNGTCCRDSCWRPVAAAQPMSRDPVRQATGHQVRRYGNGRRDDQRLTRIDPAGDDDLVNHVDDDRGDE